MEAPEHWRPEVISAAKTSLSGFQLNTYIFSTTTKNIDIDIDIYIDIDFYKTFLTFSRTQ